MLVGADSRASCCTTHTFFFFLTKQAGYLEQTQGFNALLAGASEKKRKKEEEKSKARSVLWSGAAITPHRL